jgi:CheY-like chemotaxis protein
VQADSTISRKFGGTGLGLTICRNMIEMQNGELLVNSEEGKGSVFTIRIPYQLSTEAMQENETNQDIDFKSLGRKRVLVAEDVELNQYLARHILESWDFEVTIVNNGREAVEKMQAERFDCILMDVQMPEMDGLEATRHIRQLKDSEKAAIPIIALTANALKGDSERYIAAGMNDYLSKPFDEAKLFRVISRNLTEPAPPATAKDISGLTAGQPAPNGAGAASPTLSENNIPLKNHTRMLPENKLYDLSMVQSVSGGDESFIKKMVALFIETVPGNLDDLVGAVQSENWDQVAKTAHKLKSTVDSMGIKSIRQEIRTVEANAKAKTQVEEIPGLVNKIGSVINDCIVQLQAEIVP